MRVENKLDITVDNNALDAEIQQIKSLLKIELVSRTALEPLWDRLVKDYHYLGHEKTIGPRVKYIIWLGERPVSAISFNQASYRLGVRDKFIDWSDAEKKNSLVHVLNNNRFLILPWVKIKNMASYIMALSIRQLKVDWLEIYKIEPYLIETFVDKEKYIGTCYQASNWLYVGESGGYEKVGNKYKYHGNKKAVYLYPIKKNFKNLIGCTGRPGRVLKINNEHLEMVYMQLQKNDWHPKLLEEAKVKEIVCNLPAMLKQHMERFKKCFHRTEQEFNGNIYVKGLLSELERKSVEPIALEFNDDKRGVRNLQFFMKDAKWDDKEAQLIFQEGLAQKISEPDGMFTIDESGNVKKGRNSVGVARQYCGSVGKVENSQVGVYLGYSSSKGYGLISSKLFMPEKWFGEDYEKRRTECLVPEGLSFQTKPEIATGLLDEAEKSNLFLAKWVGIDSLYGNSKEFLNSIPKKYWYFADIHNDSLIWRSEPIFEIPEYAGKGRKATKKSSTTKPEKVSSIANDENLPWRSVCLGYGSKGAVYAQIKCIRVYRAFEKVDGEIEAEACWLFIRRREDGETRFSVSNAPETIRESELCKASLMRWPIEQCFDEMKGQLGMDHYEFRSWPAWHRHMLLVFIAYEFLLEIRLIVVDKKKPHSVIENGNVISDCFT